MKERPIIFSGPMVRAIRQETNPKTQTRRPVTKAATLDWLEAARFTPEFVAAPENHMSPYGYAGDRLWVRETFATVDEGQGHRGDYAIYWRADVTDPAMIYEWRWTPAIHMPRSLCRQLLDIKGVRIERLWDISAEDAFAEGIDAMRCPDCHLMAYGVPGWGHDDLQPTPVEAYFHLWDQINEGRGYGRSKNPWVWVVDFRRTS